MRARNDWGYSVALHRTDAPPQERFLSKWERCKRIEQLLAQRAYTRAALARRLGVHRATVGRYIDQMSGLLPIAEDDQGRLSLCPNR